MLILDIKKMVQFTTIFHLLNHDHLMFKLKNNQKVVLHFEN
jgi:hypothetical protein